MSELETKDSSERFEFKQEGDEGLVSGLLSTFGNIDLGDDVVEAGAFKRSLNSMKKAGKGLKMLVNHSTNQRAGMFPVGGKDGLKETDEGLLTPGAPLNLGTQTGSEAFSDAKFGLLDSFSIGFIPMRVEFVRRKTDDGEKRMIRRILEARLMETSLVVFPMNPKAAMTGTKSRWEEEETEEKRVKIFSVPALDAELEVLRNGPTSQKSDSASVFAALDAELTVINNTLKGA